MPVSTASKSRTAIEYEVAARLIEGLKTTLAPHMPRVVVIVHNPDDTTSSSRLSKRYCPAGSEAVFDQVEAAKEI